MVAVVAIMIGPLPTHCLPPILELIRRRSSLCPHLEHIMGHLPTSSWLCTGCPASLLRAYNHGSTPYPLHPHLEHIIMAPCRLTLPNPNPGLESVKNLPQDSSFADYSVS